MLNITQFNINHISFQDCCVQNIGGNDTHIELFISYVIYVQIHQTVSALNLKGMKLHSYRHAISSSQI